MSPWRIWRYPLWIGVLTAVGLVAGLVSDGWGDGLAAVGLGVPAAAAVFFGLRRSRGEGPSLQRQPTLRK